VSLTELVGGAIGSTLAILGASAVVIWAIRRQSSDRLLLYFGLWCCVYGVRLVASLAFVREAIGGSARTWNYLGAFATYVINVPGALFVEAQVGTGWKRSLRLNWQVLSVYAAAAIAIDLVVGRPAAAMPLNNPLVLLSVAAWTFNLWIYRDRLSPVFKTRAIAVSVVFLTLFVVNENLGRPVLPAVRTEPIGVFVFVIGLGYSVVANVFQREAELLAVNRELATARQIQNGLLPPRVPDVSNLDLAVRYQPMTAVAGDFYDFAVLGPDRIGILVADVSGHGIPAALVASMVKVAFSTESAHTTDPAEVLAGMNRTLCGNMEQSFVTAVFAVIDSARGTLSYANAGHPPLLVARTGDDVHPCDEHGLMLGVFPHATYTNAELPLAPGDCVFLFTDGVPEAQDPNGTFLDTDRVKSWLRLHRGESAQRIADLTLRELQDWRASASFEDDVTFVVARLKE
jgi:hypothetical protein